MTSGGSNRKPDVLRARALQMVKDGYTTREAADTLGISKQAIRKWMQNRSASERTPEPKELPEGIKMLHAWPPRGAATVDE